MGTFEVQYMLADQALVTGADTLGNSGSTVVSTRQWTELQQREAFKDATAKFDEAVRAFIKPITDAAEAAEAATKAATEPDPVEFVVIDEGEESVTGKPKEVIELEKDTIILRLIDAGQTDRLVWVSPTELGILARA